MDLAFQTEDRPQSKWTFDRTLLSNEQYLKHIKQWVTEYYDINRYSSSRCIVWDSFKVGLWEKQSVLLVGL